jgi:glycosyltransferase involved in cell wall biosynthesis
VKDWADEIVFVDSYSTDDTLEIARRYTDNIEQRPWPGFCEQYNYCTKKALNDWVIFVDADEVISPELAKEILQRIEMDAGKFDGYIVRRRTFYLGKWIMHGGWVSDYKVRVFRKSKGDFEGTLHTKVWVRGKVAWLRNYFQHYTYRDIADQIDTINNYSDSAAGDMFREGRPFSYFDLFLRPPFRFIKEYLFRRGFLDGMPGFVIAISTMYYVFIKYAKLWELRKGLKEPRNH